MLTPRYHPASRLKQSDPLPDTALTGSYPCPDNGWRSRLPYCARYPWCARRNGCMGLGGALSVRSSGRIFSPTSRPGLHVPGSLADEEGLLVSITAFQMCSDYHINFIENQPFCLSHFTRLARGTSSHSGPLRTVRYPNLRLSSITCSFWASVWV